MSNGSSAAPIAERACRPGSPHSSNTRSLKPLIAAGVTLNPGAQLTKPSAFTQPGDAVEVAELLLQRGEHREPGLARGLVGLLHVTSAPTLPLTSTSLPSSGP